MSQVSSLLPNVSHSGDLFGRQFRDRLALLTRLERVAARDAAALATRTTRGAFTPLRPQNVPPRRGRNHQGRMVDALVWRETADGVGFDTQSADSAAPHWIIQEIGTGQRAVLRQPGMKNPAGRPKKDATYVRAVPAQRGRLIPAALAFGTGPRGSYTPPGAATGQQLYLRSRLRGAPRGAAATPLVITKEIDGQHFVQKGGQEGFREYRTSVLAAARQAFRKRRP